ncbi:MAG: hypothetical protein ABIN89_06820 [Chitinophagaceae bacterium]
MTVARHKQHTYNVLPFILFVIALLFLVALLFTIKTDVFFSGDAGLKYLMIRQISEGGRYDALNLQSPGWVSDIWSNGYYPFKIPFIYDEPAGKIVSFPPAFQWLNANLYKWFGYKGIYIIPCASVIGLWIWLIAVLKRAGVKPLMISLGFFLLAFGSPLTIYGAVYWEHSFAVLLIFSAVVYLVTPPATYYGTMLLGALSGAAVWFRPEMLLLCLLFIVMVLYNYFKNKDKGHVVFVFSALAGIATFFLFNIIVYGNSLGAHSYQLAKGSESTTYLQEKLIILTHINARIIIYFPVFILIYVFAIFTIISKPIRFKAKGASTGNANLIRFDGKRLPSPIINQLTVIAILFSLFTPFVLPNAGGKQWGPRYFLPLVPIVITTLCLATSNLKTTKPLSRKWLTLIVPVIFYVVYLNVYKAHKNLHYDYAYRVKPGLHFLEKNTCDILVVQNQYIAQEIAALFEKKKIFLAENQDSFNRLCKLLQAAGVSRIIYMASDSKNRMLANTLMNGSGDLVQVGNYYFAEYNFRIELDKH